ncbi:retrovirus-related Pol polyprotein from transposon 297 [Trichonephila clavipes]|nr:retrovirus-related Pol polyprotein from transposon 297 [Trichonephila clavipes]
MTSETVEVARIALGLPTFWKSNVHLWIAQCDHAFTFSGISSDDTKYSALVANLDAETLSFVSDIVLSPPNSDKYHTLSQRLITQFSDSETQKIKKLLTDLQLGDEKPNHLLRKMKELSNGQLQDDFLQSLWLQRMSPHIQTVLSASSEPLDKLAIIADKVSEVVGAFSTICAATTVPPPSQSSSCSVQPTMDFLARQIQELSLQVAELTRERNSSRHQRYSSDRRRSHSRSRSVNRGSGICYYHRRYKEQPASVFHLVHLCKRTNSGSEICVIPPSPTMNKPPQSNFSLFAANNTKIPAYDLPKSPWSSPLHVVPKSDSTVRPVGDYRQLNSVTEFDSYHMPNLNDFAHALHGKRIFSKIDIFKAFHQIPIAECDIRKTAVTTPWGLYEYTHLCFGLVNAPQTFMRFMHEVLRGLPFCFFYLDDILCYSENAEGHRSHLRTIFQRLSSYGLKLNISKCVFGVTELIFLGHLITPDGIKPVLLKLRFLPKAAEQQYLLSEFLKSSKGKKDSKPLNWSSEAITAFQRCKQALADAALLAHPSPSAPLALHVDASDYAIGGALHQVVDSELQPLAFSFSRKLTSSEKSYSAYDRELLCYLLGYPRFSVYAGS